MFLPEGPVLGHEEWMCKDGSQPVISFTVISWRIVQGILQEKV